MTAFTCTYICIGPSRNQLKIWVELYKNPVQVRRNFIRWLCAVHAKDAIRTYIVNDTTRKVEMIFHDCNSKLTHCLLFPVQLWILEHQSKWLWPWSCWSSFSGIVVNSRSTSILPVDPKIIARMFSLFWRLSHSCRSDLPRLSIH